AGWPPWSCRRSCSPRSPTATPTRRPRTRSPPPRSGTSAPTASRHNGNVILVFANLEYTRVMPDLWSDLVACLDLTRVPPAGHGGGGAAPSDARPPDAEFQFEGSNQQLPYHRVFGGQILGQVVRAAALSFPGKQLKSLHALFPREGRSEEPIRYRVRACHEGRTFASATVIAEQSAGVVATASLSLHTPEQGPRRQSTDPVPVLPSAEHKADWDLLPWEVRARREIDDKGSSAPEFEFWM